MDFTDPIKYIEDFREYVNTVPPEKSNARTFRAHYYRALLISPEVRRARVQLQKGNIAVFHLRLDSAKSDALANYSNLEDRGKSALISILQFHLNNFSGLPNTSENLEKIERDLNEVCYDIFQDYSIKIHVETLADSEGKFRVSIS